MTDAPDIIVNSYTYRQHDADRTVTCKPSGNPDIYTYYKWQHKSRYGELIREFVGNKTLKLPDVPVSSRYQDSGEYVCIASNGIKDKYNKFEQTGSGYLTVNGNALLLYFKNTRIVFSSVLYIIYCFVLYDFKRFLMKGYVH